MGLADGISKKGTGKNWGVRSHIFSFPDGAVVKNPPANAGDARDRALIPESGRFPGVGNGNLLQYSCLDNSMDRGATVHGVAKSQTQLSNRACVHYCI